MAAARLLTPAIGRFDDHRVEWVYSRPVGVADDGTMIPFAVDLTRRSQLDFFPGHRELDPSLLCRAPRMCLERYRYWPEDVPSAG